VALFLGYRGVANSPFVSVQLPYVISGGFGGVLLCGGGIALLVMADLHDEWRKLDRIEAAILGHWLPSPFDGPDRPASGPTAGLAPVKRAPAGFVRRSVRLGAGMMLALAVLAMAWERAAGTTEPRVGYQGVAVGSLALLLMLAAGGSAVVGRRVELTRRRTLLLGGWATSATAEGEGTTPATRTATGQVFITSTSRRFHRSACPTLTGLDAAAVRRDAVPPGLEPCGICGAS